MSAQRVGMLVGRHVQPRTGIESYDTIRFRDWLPQTRRVHLAPSMDGLAVASPANAVGVNEAEVPAPGGAIIVYFSNNSPAFDCRLDGGVQRVAMRGQTFVALPRGLDTWWSFDPAVANGVFQLHFAPDTITHAAAEMGGGVFPCLMGDNDPLAIALINRAQAAIERDEPPTRLMWDSLAHLLALRIMELDRPRQAKRAHRGGLAGWQVRRTTEFLTARLSEPVSLAELASIANLSRFHFARAFRQSVGLPPHRYQQRLRIEKAKEMLRLTELSVTEIALSVGYETPQALSRVFVRMVGVAPSQYRRE